MSEDWVDSSVRSIPGNADRYHQEHGQGDFLPSPPPPDREVEVEILNASKELSSETLLHTEGSSSGARNSDTSEVRHHESTPQNHIVVDDK